MAQVDGAVHMGGAAAAVGGGEGGHLAAELRARGLSQTRTLIACWAVHGALTGVGVRAARSSTAVAVASAWALTSAWLLWSGVVGRSGARP